MGTGKKSGVPLPDPTVHCLLPFHGSSFILSMRKMPWDLGTTRFKIKNNRQVSEIQSRQIWQGGFGLSLVPAGSTGRLRTTPVFI